MHSTKVLYGKVFAMLDRMHKHRAMEEVDDKHSVIVKMYLKHSVISKI